MWPSPCLELLGTAQLWAGAEHIPLLLMLRSLQIPALVPLSDGANPSVVVLQEEGHMWAGDTVKWCPQRPPLLGQAPARTAAGRDAPEPCSPVPQVRTWPQGGCQSPEMAAHGGKTG